MMKYFLTKDGGQVYPITSVETSGQVWTSDGNGTGNWRSISSGVFSVNGDDAYYTAGNIGVGTTTPTVKLDVNETVVNAFLIGSEDNNPPVQFMTNDVVRMTILTNGNAGIGTKIPTSKIHVTGIVSKIR